MGILAYTTQIAPEKTMGEITGMLAKAGARKIATDYDGDGEATGLSFVLEVNEGTYSAFALPVRAERVCQVLSADRSVAPKYQNMEQARRVAWRIIKTWLAAQLAIVETSMVTMEEVMLPYMQDSAGSGTLYEAYLTGGIKALTA
jgi:hypothetical protein